MGSRLGQRASKCACLVVPPLFRADSGTNLIKQGENVKGRPCGSIAQLAECSHGKREALGSSPGRATIFSSPVTKFLIPIDLGVFPSLPLQFYGLKNEVIAMKLI